MSGNVSRCYTTNFNHTDPKCTGCESYGSCLNLYRGEHGNLPDGIHFTGPWDELEQDVPMGREWDPELDG